MSGLKSPFFWFVLAVLTTAALTALGPQEQSLGSNVRIVYLHAAWVLTAEAVLGLSALAGLLGILFRRERPHHWSAALGRTGLFFWVTDLPLSVWAMQANWNGLFLGEPRFRLAVIFAATGVLLQIGLTLLARPVFTSLFNVLFFVALWIGLKEAGYVLHPPPSPIFSSGIFSLQLFFIGIVLLTMMAAWFMTRWWLSR
ncbi:MAG: hypothetical protein NTV38_01480 [Chloroflexi bacterium]|nr:hypothetical protein [Chloroflexota bacterium]